MHSLSPVPRNGLTILGQRIKGLGRYSSLGGKQLLLLQ